MEDHRFIGLLAEYRIACERVRFYRSTNLYLLDEALRRRSSLRLRVRSEVWRRKLLKLAIPIYPREDKHEYSTGYYETRKKFG